MTIHADKTLIRAVSVEMWEIIAYCKGVKTNNAYTKDKPGTKKPLHV